MLLFLDANVLFSAALTAQGRAHALVDLAAAAAGADWLVTGDRRHFAHLIGLTLNGIKVIRLADAVRLILGTLAGNSVAAEGTRS